MSLTKAVVHTHTPVTVAVECARLTHFALSLVTPISAVQLVVAPLFDGITGRPAQVPHPL